MTLLSIVGEDISRIIPVLYAYKDEIKHHILLCDDDPANYNRAKTLMKGMKNFSSKYHLGWFIEIITTDEDNAEQIKHAAKNQFKNNHKLWLNITDGYPTISILLSALVQKDGGKILSYDHFDNDLHIIDSDGNMTCQQLNSNMSLENYITLLNYKIVDKKPLNYLKKRKKYIQILYENESDFYDVRNALVFPEQYKNFDESKYQVIFDTLFLLGILDENKNFIPSKQLELQGDLFEEYIYWLCSELDFDDIAMGVKIDFDDSSSESLSQRRVHNEFDILMTKNNRIYTVECKFSKNLKGLDFVYKYDAIIDYFGRASKAIIANISPNKKEHYIGMNSSTNFRHSTLRRARMSAIRIYHEAYVDVIKFQNLVQTFFKVGYKNG